MKTNFLGPAYKARSLPLSCQTVVNLLFEPPAPGSSGDGMLFQRDGLSLWTTVGAGPLRGGRTLEGYAWVVSGDTLYRVASDGTKTSIGTVPGTGRVHIEQNETQIVVMHSAGWHVCNPASLSWASVPDAPTTAQGTYLAGRIVFPNANGTFGWTELNVATLDALNFASAEFRPDNVVAVWSDSGQLLIFGETTLEFMGLTSSAELPYQRTAVVDFGLTAIRSVAADDNSVFFVGRNENGDNRVYRLQQYSPVGISDFALDKQLADYGDLSGAYGMCYQVEGHAFYQLTIPGLATWVYDIATQRWQQFGYWNETAELEPHLGLFHFKLGGRHYFGSRVDNKLYQASADYATDDGNEILTSRRFTFIENAGKNIRHKSFELFAEMGVGLDGGVFGSDPKVILSWSDDMGRSFVPRIELSLGKLGEYRNRAIKKSLGFSRNRVYSIECTAPVRKFFYGVELEVEPMSR